MTTHSSNNNNLVGGGGGSGSSTGTLLSGASSQPQPPPPPSTQQRLPQSSQPQPPGFGKMLYFLDQMKLEVTDADQNIKNLQTEMKCLVRTFGRKSVYMCFHIHIYNCILTPTVVPIFFARNVCFYRRKRIKNWKPRREIWNGN